ncbi:Golgi integral membrane protein 4 [Venturia canescens]|uniref:Golgi integral membrane protein 4 n=1 Tax=Venturia canescens TaxID=32260 RepID=UPI001C9C567D|nr:Golgi integral membrane protein 4-like [Venturia canescens]
MSGSRLGRGRGGRLAVYGACGVVVVLLVFLYRAATSEMSRLREMHAQCIHQQETFAEQLQVVFEYKVRLEKSLAEEKSSNAAVKQELQQRATREKSLRDKDSVEALRRFNSLQQTHKILQSEHQDLKEDCEKQQKQALEDRKRLEVTLRDLRSQLREAREDKEKSLEHLKTKYLEVDTDKSRLEDKYNALLKNTANDNSTIEHLRKEVMQLNRELKENSCKSSSSGPIMISQGSDHQLAQPNAANEGVQGVAIDEQQGARPSSQQQQIAQSVATSPEKLGAAAKVETSTKSGVNSASTIANKSANPVVPVKSAPKVKLPFGVLPILNIIDSNVELNAKAEETKKIGDDKNAAVRDNANEGGKNRGPIQPANNAVPQVSGRRHMGEQILNGPDDAEWFRAKGIQEIGDDLGNEGKMQDFEDGQVRAGADGADYDNYYNKGPQQKNPEESEDEGEEEDVADYMNNNEMKKQE